MKKIPNPTQESFDVLFGACVEGKLQKAKNILVGSFGAVSKYCKSYSDLAANFELYKLSKLPETALPDGAKAELNKLYEERFTRDTSPGRKVYDNILLANKCICPFCAHGRSWTVDHFLPKDEARYPELSVFPENLVPCCRDCNSFKGTYFGEVECEQLLHPYFDDPDHITWLEAKLHYSGNGENLTVTYYADPNTDDLVLSARIQTQFARLRLNELYSAQASSELVDLGATFLNLKMKKGKLAVVERIKEDYDAFSSQKRNSWKTALFRAALSDPDFADLKWVE